MPQVDVRPRRHDEQVLQVAQRDPVPPGEIRPLLDHRTVLQEPPADVQARDTGGASDRLAPPGRYFEHAARGQEFNGRRCTLIGDRPRVRQTVIDDHR